MGSGAQSHVSGRPEHHLDTDRSPKARQVSACLSHPERKGTGCIIAASPEQGNSDRSRVEGGVVSRIICYSWVVCVCMCAAPTGIPEIVPSAGDLWPFLLSGSSLQLSSFAHSGYESGPFSKGKRSAPKMYIVNKFNHCVSARWE